MALLWADDFKSFGDDEGAMTDGVYVQREGSLSPDPDVLASGNVFHFDNSAVAETMRYAIQQAPVATLGAAQRIWYPVLPTSGKGDFLTFRDENNVIHVTIAIGSTGTVYVYRGTSSSGTELGNTGAPVLTANAWHHVEAKVLVDDSVGTVEVCVNGLTVLSLTGQDTRNGGISTIGQVGWGNGNSISTFGKNYYLKDVVIWDTAGSQNNDFMGTVSVIRLAVLADDTFNWTASTGTTGYNLIDETGPDDADYVEAANPPPAASVFTLEDLPTDVTSVRGLVSLVRAKNTDGGDGKLQVSLVSNGSDALGTDRQLTTAETYYRDVSELSPDTGVAWTPAEVDAAKIKIDRTL